MSIQHAGQMYDCGDDDASLRARQRTFLNRVRKTAHASDATPAPRIDHGRWLVDCPCGSGAGVSKAGKAYCFECGAIMTVILPAPDQKASAEALLAERKEPFRNWRPDRESIEHLKLENTLKRDLRPRDLKEAPHDAA